MSTAPRLPTVRLPTVIASAGSEPSLQDSVVLDLPPSGKFGFAWAADAGPAPSLPSLGDRHVSLSSSDADSATSDHEPEAEESCEIGNIKSRRLSSSGTGRKGYSEESDESDFITPTNRLNLDQNPLDQASPPLVLPRLSRAFSVPLPSQIGCLKNPKRESRGEMDDHLDELSQELADSFEMIIQTFLQLSPPQVFDPAKEQYSACALAIPTPSVSALFTVMKSLNYISANIAAFSTSSSINKFLAPIRDFDIGQTLQSVGDALSGLAADLAVDLVLFHGDVGMKHIAVKGDEIAISFTLSHVSQSTTFPFYILIFPQTQIVRQILATAHPGDSLQLGLFLVAPVRLSPDPLFDLPLDATEPADTISPPDPNLPLSCTFQITHNAPNRTKPFVRSHILQHLVRHINATFVCESTETAFTCKLSMTFDRGSPAVVNPAIILSDNDPILRAFPDLKLSGEPTLEDLAQFVGTLKGKKVSLYANATGMFAQHLTSYLTSWGLDVSHACSDSDTEGSPPREVGNLPSLELSDTGNDPLGTGTVLHTLSEQDSPPSAPLTPKAPTQSPSFILIDDDISVLRDRLRKLRAELLQPFQPPRKRPNLSANHRPRSSPQVARTLGHSPAFLSPRNSAVIIHFTSLANFKLVKGILHSVLGPSNGQASPLPEVIVIPKPAGPRRVLTALHTAATKPIVEPSFSPIATSPISPTLYPAASYLHQNVSLKSPMTRPSNSPRSFSYQPMRSPRTAVEPGFDSFALPPSPLGLSEGMDYFSEAAEKLGSSSSSGLVIQSPNGQPQGIFFHPPRSRSSRPSSHSVSVESGPACSRGGSRRLSDAPERTRPVTFLSFPGTLQQRRSQTPQTTLDPGRSGVAESLTAIPDDEALATSATSVAAGTSAGAARQAKRGGTVDVLRKTASPPSSPRTSPTNVKSPTVKRGLGSRRQQSEKGSSAPASPMKKAKPSEPSIVPPISVLIVEGVLSPLSVYVLVHVAERWVDNPINQTLLSTFMRKKKIKYDIAKNGEEAVEKWRTGRFHLILVGPVPVRGVALSHGCGFRWIFKCPSWTASPRPRRSADWKS
jgi:osomolarity two-component system, response regulator SSK1